MKPPAIPNAKQHSSTQRWKRFACYVPLATIGRQVAWVILLFAALIFAVGDTPYRNTPSNQRLFEFIWILPAIAGAIFGAIAMVCRWPQNPLDWVCLVGALWFVVFLLSDSAVSCNFINAAC
jgi:hypothetical protein